MFEKFDEDNFGTIDKDELRSFVKNMMGQDGSVKSEEAEEDQD